METKIVTLHPTVIFFMVKEPGKPYPLSPVLSYFPSIHLFPLSCPPHIISLWWPRAKDFGGVLLQKPTVQFFAPSRTFEDENVCVVCSLRPLRLCAERELSKLALKKRKWEGTELSQQLTRGIGSACAQAQYDAQRKRVHPQFPGINSALQLIFSTLSWQGAWAFLLLW